MREYFLVDGYNYLHYLRRARTPGRKELGLAGFVAELENYAAAVDGEIEVVLDGTRWKDCVPPSRLLRVHCTDPGVTADAYCERWMSQLPVIDRRRYMLVSDDRALGLMATGLGVRWARCEWFAKEINARRSSRIDSAEPQDRNWKRFGDGFNTPFGGL